MRCKKILETSLNKKKEIHLKYHAYNNLRVKNIKNSFQEIRKNETNRMKGIHIMMIDDEDDEEDSDLDKFKHIKEGLT